MKKKEELNIVTEVGVFGNLDIDDPTVKKVKKKNGKEYNEDEMDALIKESINANANIKV